MFDKFIHNWLAVPYRLHVYTKRSVKKPRATVLLLHGIGNSGAAWQEVVNSIPPDVRVISIDLLGFGKSPRPKRAVYDSRTQARAVIATLIRAGVAGKLIIVGHSLGALVAVEVAKRYPAIIKSLILCSPPFYNNDNDTRFWLRREQQLRMLYRLIQHHPEQFVAISTLAMKYKLVNKAFSVTTDDVETYMETLESSILNQTALEDASRLKKPITIIHGRFDSYVIRSNLSYLQKHNPLVRLRVIAAGHEIRGQYNRVVNQELNKQYDTPRKLK